MVSLITAYDGEQYKRLEIAALGATPSIVDYFVTFFVRSAMRKMCFC